MSRASGLRLVRSITDRFTQAVGLGVPGPSKCTTGHASLFGRKEFDALGSVATAGAVGEEAAASDQSRGQLRRSSSQARVTF